MYISEPAEYAILGLLQSQPMHGYEMFQQFRNSALREIVHLEMSQMYAFLKKLERLEYIEAQLEPQGARPPRKIFHLTTQGRALLFQWLSEPAERPREIRILFLIKLYFVQQFTPGETAALVNKQIAACRSFLEHLEAKHPLHARQHSPALPTLSGPPRITTRAESAYTPGQDEWGETGDEAFLERVVLRERIYQTRSLLDWLHELQRELAETK